MIFFRVQSKLLWCNASQNRKKRYFSPPGCNSQISKHPRVIIPSRVQYSQQWTQKQTSRIIVRWKESLHRNPPPAIHSQYCVPKLISLLQIDFFFYYYFMPSASEKKCTFMVPPNFLVTETLLLLYFTVRNSNITFNIKFFSYIT